MSHIEIQQQDAKTLAAGYTRGFRYVEIASILAFWTLMGVLVYRVWPLADAYSIVIASAFFAGFIFADFVSGFVHWLADTWGDTDMPVIGKTLLRPFREHHVDPKAMTKHDYVETNGANCMISVPVALAMAFVPLNVEGYVGFALFGVVSMGSMIFWVMMTNQIHKWSHLDLEKTPLWLRALQKAHLVLPPDHHQIHHTAPFDRYYCITTGWLNWPLTKLGFYRGMERVIMATTGAIPRKDDIGLLAALTVAPRLEAQPAAVDQKA